MERQIFLWILCLTLFISASAESVRKSDLKILYVGPSAADTVATDRIQSFEMMLKRYFKTVKVVKAADYTPEMSKYWDVTVMDGLPKVLVPEILEKDANGKVIKYQSAGYLPEDFDRPMLTVASLGAAMGERIGLKTDWYCLCLDADAHHFRKEHAIFNGPFPVKMTVRMCPTPTDAYEYAYFSDGPLPDSIPMWKVQTKGYITDEGYAPGMVARPGGFEDSPEAEYISSGVCAKDLGAVAIGRHGNFLHWGFVASPADMTEEAQVVLANAIVYISRFAGQKPIARKYNDRIATRDDLKELKHLSTRKAWKAWGQEGESYEGFVKRYQEEAFERFGIDEQAYVEYYDSNKDYFYGGEGMYKLVVDEDVKSLGIPNNDQKLLDTAIGLLEKGQDTEKACRILNRYTLCRFITPGEWRNWYETNKNRLFFTEAGGWLFLVNSRDENVLGNDYHVRDAQPVAQLPETVTTTDEDPVQLSVSLSDAVDGKREVVIRINIHPGYHIYAYVAKSDPYITTSVEVNLPEGYEKVGKLQSPAFKTFNAKGTTIYEKEVVFRQQVKGQGIGGISCKVGYQCCDNHICMPSSEKQFVVELR
ncbi:MAG: protein-disulfide reductase DsbD family protein [Odoribacter sp.]